MGYWDAQQVKPVWKLKKILFNIECYKELFSGITPVISLHYRSTVLERLFLYREEIWHVLWRVASWILILLYIWRDYDFIYQ